MADNKKRAAPTSAGSSTEKKLKTKKQWQTPKKGRPPIPQGANIEPGDAGIWATCDMGKEAKCVGELRDLFHEYAEKLYGEGESYGKVVVEDDGEQDIEAEINAEVKNMQTPDKKPLFINVRIDVQCVLFFKTRAPVEPVSFIHAICSEAAATGKKMTRFVKRLTPMTTMAKATEGALEAAARAVLAPHFHGEDSGVKKFAIRPTFRNHSTPLSRDLVIKKVADLVGPAHKVDLDNPDLVILIEVYRKICGVSVVGGDFEKLKRFNLAEILQPSEKSSEKAAEKSKEKPEEKLDEKADGKAKEASEEKAE